MSVEMRLENICERQLPILMAGVTEVITNPDGIIDAIKRFQANTRKIWCACVEASLPAFSVTTVKDGYLAAKKRGVSIMYITEINENNEPHCREIMSFAELRHLEGVRGNFALSESEYVAGILKGKEVVSLVRSDVRELVDQQRLIFQTLWHHSEPASNRLSRMDRP
jgi:hypothetical protein